MPVVADPARAARPPAARRGRRAGRPLRARASATASRSPTCSRPPTAWRPSAPRPSRRRELKGWRVAADEPFGRLLVAAGARPRRHVARACHATCRATRRRAAWLEPPLPAGDPPHARRPPGDRPRAGAACAALPAATIPTTATSATPSSRRSSSTSSCPAACSARCCAAAALAVGEDGAVAGAVLVNGKPGEPPFAGPWISADLPPPRRARRRRRAAARARSRSPRATGLPAVGLAVTHAQPGAGGLRGAGLRRRARRAHVEI